MGMNDGTFVVLTAFPIRGSPLLIGSKHRLIIWEETDEAVIFGFDPKYYGDTTNGRVKDDRLTVDKEVFYTNCVPRREFDLRWLESIRGK
jgi:hypothetical protein